MKSSQTNSVNLGPSVDQLLELMRRFPNVREETDLNLGRKVIRIAIDSIYLSEMLDSAPFHKLQKEILREAIDDLASGAPILMSSYLGIQLDGIRPVRACELYSSSLPSVYKIELIDAAAFSTSKTQNELEFHEKTANAAIYYLVDQLSLTK